MSALPEQFFRDIYAAFNRREIDTVLAAVHSDVDWPNGWEGGRVHGIEAVRDYWTRQFKAVSSNVEPQSFRTEEDGQIVVTVHQVVHDVSGNLLTDTMVEHVYTIEDGLIRKMDIRP
ncbi:nuclear transport factor 2 family protein [Alloacidobacterium dinghuense]|uniref:Nuclear transport factor 2 family protein n=1 Tax=Alloacidobacterium dinghuense TaxID=2763107 RepID=A0A7G8BJE4_9BACT|nr:nuclear transport factor 2 family protein [Alloacidobacterium dinghuense]QNI32664.1 nuclear transport factor 2 family protein [Alloacidobacterium dinghuense]